MEHDGVKFVMQKSLVDDRPLATSFLEQREKLLVQTDFVNFKSREDAAAYLKELSDEYDIETGLNEARFSNIFIEKRASTCPQSLEKSRLFSYALLVSECENFQNMKRIFLRKVVI